MKKSGLHRYPCRALKQDKPLRGPETLSFNLKAAVEREKAVQAIDVQREWKNCVVTFWVMSQFLNFLGASRGCTDFHDPTAVFRFKWGQE